MTEVMWHPAPRCRQKATLDVNFFQTHLLGRMELPETPHVLIYLTPWCPYCNRALALLRRKGVAFKAFDVTGQPDVRKWLEDLSGQHTVPQIFINQRSIGGCDELHALERSGKLDALLVS